MFRSELEAAHEKARRAEAGIVELEAARARLEKRLAFTQKPGRIAGLVMVSAFFSGALMASFLWSKIRIVEGNASENETKLAEAVAARTRIDAETAACEAKTDACLAAKRRPPALPPVEDAPDPTLFNARAASAALDAEATLLHSCHSRPWTAEVHVTVTFATSGRVTEATVTSPPSAAPPADIKCIQAMLKKDVSVPPFKGDETAVGKTLRME